MLNDPRRFERREAVDRPTGPVPLLLVSLVLWSLLLAVLPAWLLGALVAVLLAGCALSALLPSLSSLRSGRFGVRTARLA